MDLNITPIDIDKIGICIWFNSCLLVYLRVINKHVQTILCLDISESDLVIKDLYEVAEGEYYIGQWNVYTDLPEGRGVALILIIIIDLNFIKTKLFTRDFGKTANKMEKEELPTLMDRYSKETGLMV